VEVTVKAEDGVPLRYGRTSRTVPDSLRRAILHRDGNTCAADGCQSRYRLQIHHIHHWAEGGPTDPENLIALCSLVHLGWGWTILGLMVGDRRETADSLSPV